ncbi:hypothetical protein BVI1335_3250004 [Burkholderia vietnamiensis]|nr:hypothetical protein BVI1335_3250004 [Burkholderia vietnamiensis]
MGLVADFSESDGAGGDQEGLRHVWGSTGRGCACERRFAARRALMRRAVNHRSRQATVAASAMAERPSLLTDASVTMRAGGAGHRAERLLPNERRILARQRARAARLRLRRRRLPRGPRRCRWPMRQAAARRAAPRSCTSRPAA